MSPNIFERIKPVDPDVFRFALGVYEAAATMKGPFPNPETFSLNLVESSRSVSKISFTDRPENRGMMALKKEFPDADEFQSVAFRVLTFSEILADSTLVKEGLIRKTGKTGELEIEDSVIVALAKAPYKKSGKLDRRAFRALIKIELERNSEGEVE